MLLSSVIPIANATPAREMTLMVRPIISKPRKEAIVHTGIPLAPSRVAETERKNRNSTVAANIAPINRFCITTVTASFIYWTSSLVSSMRRPFCFKTVSFIDAALSITASIISTTLAPVSRRMPTVILGRPLAKALTRTSNLSSSA